MDTPPASQQVTSLDDLAQGRGYIRLITLPSGPLSVTAATEHHVINANKSFTKEQLLCRGGDGGGGIQFGRGSSMEAKETEEKAKQMGYTGPSADSSDGKYYTKVASRVHAKLELRGRQLLLTDLGSFNGTYILAESTGDGLTEAITGLPTKSFKLEQHTPVPLKEDDIITLGDTARTDPATHREHQPIRAKVVFSGRARADIDVVPKDPEDRHVSSPQPEEPSRQPAGEARVSDWVSRGKYTVCIDDSDDDEEIRNETEEPVKAPAGKDHAHAPNGDDHLAHPDTAAEDSDEVEIIQTPPKGNAEPIEPFVASGVAGETGSDASMHSDQESVIAISAPRYQSVSRASTPRSKRSRPYSKRASPSIRNGSGSPALRPPAIAVAADQSRSPKLLPFPCKLGRLMRPQVEDEGDVAMPSSGDAVQPLDFDTPANVGFDKDGHDDGSSRRSRSPPPAIKELLPLVDTVETTTEFRTTCLPFVSHNPFRKPAPANETDPASEQQDGAFTASLDKDKDDAGISTRSLLSGKDKLAGPLVIDLQDVDESDHEENAFHYSDDYSDDAGQRDGLDADEEDRSAVIDARSDYDQEGERSEDDGRSESDRDQERSDYDQDDVRSDYFKDEEDAGSRHDAVMNEWCDDVQSEYDNSSNSSDHDSNHSDQHDQEPRIENGSDDESALGPEHGDSGDVPFVFEPVAEVSPIPLSGEFDFMETFYVPSQPSDVEGDSAPDQPPLERSTPTVVVEPTSVDNDSEDSPAPATCSDPATATEEPIRVDLVEELTETSQVEIAQKDVPAVFDVDLPQTYTREESALRAGNKDDVAATRSPRGVKRSFESSTMADEDEPVQHLQPDADAQNRSGLAAARVRWEAAQEEVVQAKQALELLTSMEAVGSAASDGETSGKAARLNDVEASDGKDDAASADKGLENAPVSDDKRGEVIQRPIKRRRIGRDLGAFSLGAVVGATGVIAGLLWAA